MNISKQDSKHLRIFRLCPSPRNLHSIKPKIDQNQISFTVEIERLRVEQAIYPGGWAESVQKNNCIVFETLFDDYALQAKWIIENGRPDILKSKSFLIDVLCLQLDYFRPDVLFIYAGCFNLLNRRDREYIAQHCEWPLLITGLWGDQESDEKIDYRFSDLEILFTTNLGYQKKFSEVGIKTLLLPNSFEPRGLKNCKKKYDVTFCGETGFGFPDHTQRYEILRKLCQEDNINIKIWSNEPCRAAPISKLIAILCLNWLSLLPLKILRNLPNNRFVNDLLFLKNAKIDAKYIVLDFKYPNSDYFLGKFPLKKLFKKKVIDKFINYAEYINLINESKIVINIHRDEHLDYGNIRCFEVTGVGACLLSDRGGELLEFFDFDEFVGFRTPEECVEKIRYLLSNENEREEIALRGKFKTNKMHLLDNRCRDLIVSLKSHLTGDILR